MALWDDLVTETYDLTKRPDLVQDTVVALRTATRKAHRVGKFWRDLAETTVSPASAEVQEVDIATDAPRFRSVALLHPLDRSDLEFDPVTIDDLLDSDGYRRTNVYWGFGDKLRIRAESPWTSYRLSYFRDPIVVPASYNSWIANEHREVITTWAAVLVLGGVNESEIAGRLERLLAISIADLRSDNLEVAPR